MTHFFNPNLTPKSFETPKKTTKEIHYYNSNPNRKVISLNSNSPDNYNDEDEKKNIIKNQQKIDDNNFLDSWKVRMKQLERDEKEEKTNKFQRNKEIQNFQLNQIKEKKIKYQ